MAYEIYIPPQPNFATLYAAYPSFSSQLLALPISTRVWCESEGCFVHPSADGKHWDYELGGTGPVLATAAWAGPYGISGATTQNNLSANNARGLIYRMNNYKARSINRLNFKTNGAAVTPGGTDAFDIRLYILGPDFAPLAVAPLYVWKYNAAGSGGAGTFSLTGVIAGAGLVQAFDLPGSVTASVPPIFVLSWIHGYTPVTMVTIYAPSLTGSQFDTFPQVLSGSDPNTSTGFDRGPAWTWAETFSAGSAPVWGSVGSPVLGGNLAPIFGMKFA